MRNGRNDRRTEVAMVRQIHSSVGSAWYNYTDHEHVLYIKPLDFFRYVHVLTLEVTRDNKDAPPPPPSTPSPIHKLSLT